MTLKQFFEALPRDGWYMFRGCIRRDMQIKHDASTCPVSSLSAEFPHCEDYADAARAVGLDLDIADRIMYAADAPDEDEDSENIRELRQHLLRHCGIE